MSETDLFSPLSNTAAQPLLGRTALVTGASRGIGAAIARHLAAAGARVALTARRPEALEAVAGELPHAPLVLPGDLSDAASAQAVLAAATDGLGALDILVNNAGAFLLAPSDAIDADGLDALHALNVRAPLLLAGAAAAGMAAAGGGAIVNVSSAVGAVGTAPTSAYAATKGALDAATRALAAEWGPRGVRVNSVSPGITRTDLNVAIHGDPERLGFFEQQVPLRRIGEPADIAATVVFLASDAAAYVTGQALVVDGGWSTTGHVLSPTA
jgi:NAD(P)-dependent dehydrogenase (short-subunit alcohol dehydrogenase family)